MLYSEFIFVVTMHDQMVQIVKLCAQYQYLGSFLLKILEFYPWPGVII